MRKIWLGGSRRAFGWGERRKSKKTLASCRTASMQLINFMEK
jgi:hypothetical protein